MGAKISYLLVFLIILTISIVSSDNISLSASESISLIELNDNISQDSLEVINNTPNNEILIASDTINVINNFTEEIKQNNEEQEITKSKSDQVKKIPGFDLEIPLTESSPKVASEIFTSTAHSISEPKRIIVTLKNPSNIESWESQVSHMTTTDVKRLKSSMREYSIQNDVKQNDVKHRYSSFNGFSVTVTDEELDSLMNDPLVAMIENDDVVHTFLQDSVPLINAKNTWTNQIAGVNLTGQGQTVCIIDSGVDYTHADLGSCTPTGLGESYIESYSLSSPNFPSDYPNDYDNTWTITKSGYDHISVYFTNFITEEGYDDVIIYDKNDNEITSYSGNLGSFWSVTVPGDTIKIRFISDYSVTDSGWKINATRNSILNQPEADWSSCNKIIGGYNYAYGSNDPMDDKGHGTHVAGIVAANGLIKGVAPDAKIVAVKSLNSAGSGWSSDVIAGIEYCTANAVSKNISVISMSLGHGEYSNYCDGTDSSYASAINAATSAGISVVVATGNDDSITEIGAPSCIQNAIPISSTTKSDIISSFANRNALVKLVAPGGTNGGTESCSAGSSDSNRICSLNDGGGYISMSGTSMATPMAAGAFAIMNQYLDSQGLSRTPSQIETIFSSTGKNIVDTGGSGLTYDRINILAAIQSLDTVTPIVSITSPSSDGLSYGNTGPTISYSASDVTLQSCKWTRDNGITNNTIDCASSITGQTWAEGSNVVTVYAIDIANNVGSATRSFNVDSTNPLIDILYPGSDNLFFNEMIDINYIVSDTNLANCSFSRNVISTTNQGGSGGGGMGWAITCNEQITGQTWSQGLNSITIYAKDVVNNENSATRTFNIDTIVPIVNITSPSRDNLWFNTNISIVSQCNDTNLDACWWTSDLGVTNNSFNCNEAFNYIAIEGSNVITVYANDSYGNENSILRSFNVDSIYPLIDIVYPASDGQSYTEMIDINYIVSDTNLNSCVYSLNGGSNISLPSCQNITGVTWSQGLNTVVIYVNDTAGNSNYTTRTFNIDTLHPIIINNIMSPVQYIENLNYTFKVTVIDTNLDTVIFNYDNANRLLTQDENNFHSTIYDISTGTYYYSFWANDSFGNINSTNNLSFNVIDISDNQIIANTNSITLTDSNITEIIFPSNSIIEQITITTETVNPLLDMSYVRENNSVTLGSYDVTLVRQTNTINYTAILPANTVITAPEDWDSIISLPRVDRISNYTAPSGSLNVVINLGTTTRINFSQPIKIIIGEMAGKKASWSTNTGTMTTINTICSSVNNPGISSGECYIDSGSDLVIWTYHLTSFAAYTPSSGGNLGGGGGGGGGGTTTPVCNSYWKCTEWSDCSNGYHRRTCTDNNDCGNDDEPDTMLKCERSVAFDEPELEKEIVEETSLSETEKNQTNIKSGVGITGAVIGFGQKISKPAIFSFIALIIVIGGITIFLAYRDNEIQKNL